MSRSGYTDDYMDDDEGQWAMIRWRGAVQSAIRGARGQAFLREAAAALDAMPTKVLAANAFQTGDGEFCTLGVVAHARGVDVSGIDPEGDCRNEVAALLEIAPAMAGEIMAENDMEGWCCDDAGAKRWQYMRKWVGEHLRASGSEADHG